MAAVSGEQEPEITKGPLFFQNGNIGFSLPEVSDKMYQPGILNVRLFIKEFALSNYANIRFISTDMIVMAAAELARQRFSNYPVYHRQALESTFKQQV